MYGIFSTRLYVAITFAVLSAIMLDSWYMVTIAVLHCSFGTQILKNMVHNHRNAIKPSVYLCIAVGRLLLILYIFGCPSNFLYWRPKYWFVALMTVLIVVQIAILALQRVYGARFLLPQRFKPNVYSYYKAIPDELEMTEQIECNICLSVIEKEDPLVMTTPCNHLFHSNCLTNWMEIKLQCPTCRAELPSIEND